eukprot:4333422-Alexandrium_andersonii.AAC.1
MSASLVGSEMCIRDRRCRGGRGRRRGSVMKWSTGSWASHSVKLSWASVSYTHLTLPTICSV